MAKRRGNYVRAVVIVHGKCEKQIVEHIRSNLRLNIKAYSKNNGKNSILISSLKNELNTKYFRNKTNFCNEYPVEIKDKKIINFKLFIIMDTDNSDEIGISEYKNKSMFKEHWLFDFIVPILNEPDLDYVLHKAEIFENKKQHIKEKVKNYKKEFPINHDNPSQDNIEQIKRRSEILKSISGTNLYVFLDYCVECSEEIIIGEYFADLAPLIRNWSPPIRRMIPSH